MNDLVKFKKALEIVFETEKACYMLDNNIEQIRQEISRLGIPKKIPVPQKPFVRNNTIAKLGYSILSCAMGGLIIGIIYDLFFFKAPWWEKLFGFFGHAIIGAFYGAPVGLALGIIISIITFIINAKDNEYSYQHRLNDFKEQEKADKLRVEIELRSKKILTKQRTELIDQLKNTIQYRNIYYDQLGIDNTYRGLIPAYYMYEFSRLGISTQFEGPTGLYKLIRDEINIKQIQNSLDEISYKLDEIIDNQTKIYSEIKQINKSCNALLENTIREVRISAKNNKLLEQAVENTSMSAYYSKLAYNQQLYTNFMLAL